ncbi:hypothetical protein F3Y22_tig00110160pilonHSYRG00197 [Hibiscus syriacus]|uniref:CTLH domain-containing protein n=1 Tax=Hibiscus syriacus TaxID=106335 RepID=A0A6A3BG59_HIBSY|nr:hypothetical protein F3Y22_tig00110160pilonHSYRG00197 [Hibiscus syriacus]
MQNEICRMRLDDAVLDELVHEYCVYRGIVESGMSTLSEPVKAMDLAKEVNVRDGGEDVMNWILLLIIILVNAENKRLALHYKLPGVENTNLEEKYEIVLRMKELASRGMAAEVVEEINALDPNFFEQNPVLLFQFKQVEFLKLLGLGDHSGALRVACSHLGPLAARDPNLLKPLKETLVQLLRPSEDTLVTGLPLHALASSLQVAFGKRLGIEEPQLMRTHTEFSPCTSQI